MSRRDVGVKEVEEKNETSEKLKKENFKNFTKIFVKFLNILYIGCSLARVASHFRRSSKYVKNCRTICLRVKKIVFHSYFCVNSGNIQKFAKILMNLVIFSKISQDFYVFFNIFETNFLNFLEHSKKSRKFKKKILENLNL